MAKAKKEMSSKLRGTTDHDLNELVGKKIKEITMLRVNVSSNKESVRHFYRVKVAGRGENEFILTCPSGNNQEESKIGLMYPDDFESMIDDLVSEAHSNLEPDVDDEDDDVDLEPDGDEPVPGNLFDEVESEDDEDDVDDEDEDLEDDDF